jgi:predicted ATPase
MPRSTRRSPTSTGSDALSTAPLLTAVRFVRPSWADANRFPFCVPTIASMTSLDLDASVVCFVGENGSGKSTLLEAMAIAASLPSAGAVNRAVDDPTLADQRWLARALTLSWRTRSNRGLFLRAEDFFNFQQQLKRERAEFEDTLARMDVEYADRSPHAKRLAMGPLKASLAEMEQRYGADPDARSHGEAFLNFFQERLVPRGLYLLDEPEAALSPQRQLTLLAMMFDCVAQGAQFVVATHSPLLLAFPGARIYSFDDAPISPIAWDDTEHVRLTRDFLANPERYLRNLR